MKGNFSPLNSRLLQSGQKSDLIRFDLKKEKKLSTYNESRLGPGQESDCAAVHQQVVADGSLHQLTENIIMYNIIYNI